jgi:hypothetical protein
MKRVASGFVLSVFPATEFKVDAGACQAVDTPGCRSYVVLITPFREES